MPIFCIIFLLFSYMCFMQFSFLNVCFWSCNFNETINFLFQFCFRPFCSVIVFRDLILISFFSCNEYVLCKDSWRERSTGSPSLLSNWSPLILMKRLLY